MKRVGRLWAELTSVTHLLESAEAAAVGKRRRPDVAAFRLNLEPEVLQLRRELLSGEYRPSGYRTFRILDPKPRQISAAPFRDRVVHHAFTRMVEPVFEERRFSRHSFACRKGLGTHAALRHAQQGVRQFRYVLKCDVSKYFASIDHEILNRQLALALKCHPTLELAKRIIDGSNPQEEVNRYFPGDNLFTPFERRRGLPLGNQTSQFFANVYLSPLDRLLDEELRPGLWARYVDDLVIFDHSKQRLHQIREALREELERHRLIFHPRKTRIHTCAEGVAFLGWRLFPAHTRLARQNLRSWGRRMRQLQKDFAAGLLEWEAVEQSVRAWIAHAAFGNTWVLRGERLARLAFERGARPSRAGGRFPQ